MDDEARRIVADIVEAAKLTNRYALGHSVTHPGTNADRHWRRNLCQLAGRLHQLADQLGAFYAVTEEGQGD